MFFILTVVGCTKSESQSGEEALYMSKFMPKRNGTFVEIGAFDGHRSSNTRVLNKCHGWNGLLIEANVQNHEMLLKKLDRPRVKVIHSAVCEPPQTWVNFTTNGGAVSVDTSRVSNHFQKKWSKYNHPHNTTRVPCAPMSNLLHGYEHIDFFSLDVEGSEFTVIATIDFENVSIDTFCIEFDRHDPPKEASITKVLKQKGYARCKLHDTRNAWFRKNCTIFH